MTQTNEVVNYDYEFTKYLFETDGFLIKGWVEPSRMVILNDTEMKDFFNKYLAENPSYVKEFKKRKAS